MPTSGKNRLRVAPHEAAKFYQSPLKYIALNRETILQEEDRRLEDDEIEKINHLSKDVRSYSRNLKNRAGSRKTSRPGSQY